MRVSTVAGIGALACALACVGSWSQAAGPPPVDKIQVRGGVILGFGGEVEVEESQGGAKQVSDADLESTFGFQLEGYYPLHTYFALGVATTFRWMNTEPADARNVDRTMLLGFHVAPRARYPLLSGRLEVYAGLPIGLDITLPADDLKPQGGSLSGGVAFSFGFLPGVQYFFTEVVGAYFELGFRTVNFAFERSAQGVQPQETSGGGLQFHMQFGLAAAF